MKVNIVNASSKIPNKEFTIETFPDAIGRYFFSGCFLSNSISKISLRIYTKLETKEKPTNANIVGKILWEFNNTDEKKRGINMKRFLIQLLILNILRYFIFKQN